MNRTPYESKSEIDNIELLAFARDHRDSDGGIAWRKWTPKSQKDGARSKYQRLMRHHGFGDGEFTVDNTDEVLRYYESLTGTVASKDTHPSHTPASDTETSSESVTGELSGDEEERLLNQAGLDSGRWEVGPFWKRISDEESVMFKPKGESPLEDNTVERIIERMKQHAPEYPSRSHVPPQASNNRNMLEVCLFDAHLGMLAWGEEVGTNYDIEIAQSMYLWALESLIEQAQRFPIERILYPVGNDYYHTDKTIDGKGGVTTSGTVQETDGRWQRSFDEGLALQVQAIDLLQEVAPVDVVVVMGNHDREKIYYASRFLWAWYFNNGNVNVNCQPSPRQYYQYGRNLIGYTHGKDEKLTSLPGLMSREAPRQWADSWFREYHVGHLHRKKETHHAPIFEHDGVRVRIIPSLVDADSWHFDKGYVGGRRSAEAYLFNYEDGPTASFSANVRPDMFTDGELSEEYRYTVTQLDKIA